MNDLEDITEKIHRAYFVDLFVRVSNTTAIQMYNKVGVLQAVLTSSAPRELQSPWQLLQIAYCLFAECT